jgi:5-methylcytosine-specific restriction endonuclease McrA
MGDCGPSSKDMSRKTDPEYLRLYRLAFPERQKLADQKYYKAHRAVRAAYTRSWRLRNRERWNHFSQNYYRKNKVHVNTKVRLRQLKKLAAIPPGTDLHAISKIYARAAELRQWFDVVVDHKLPISKGGQHTPENLQIIYAFENGRKHDRLDYQPAVIFR